jgi:hypothetical protein
MSLISGQRFGSGASPRWMIYEHRARRRFAALYARGKVATDCACAGRLGAAMIAETSASHAHPLDRSGEASGRARRASHRG